MFDDDVFRFYDEYAICNAFGATHRHFKWLAEHYCYTAYYVQGYDEDDVAYGMRTLIFKVGGCLLCEDELVSLPWWDDDFEEGDEW